jgi:hypothetical protein
MSDGSNVKVLVNSYSASSASYGVIALYGSADPVGAGIRGSPAFGTRILDNNFDKFEELTGCRAKFTQYEVVNIATLNAGIVQIVAYNLHNGLYPHTVFVEWDGHDHFHSI